MVLTCSLKVDVRIRDKRTFLLFENVAFQNFKMSRIVPF